MNISVKVLRLRRVVQCAVLAALCALPWCNAQGWNMVMGNFYALDVGGVPFADPLTVVQNLITGYVPRWKLWLGAGLALGLALALGRVFCGWVCPYGLLSEWAWKLRGAKRKVLQERWGWRVRTAVVLAGLVATAWLGLPMLNALSAPGCLSLLPLLGRAGWEVMELGAAFVAVLLALDLALGTRWWCRYACPQAWLLMGMVWLRTRCGSERCLNVRCLNVRWTANCCSCKAGEEPCAQACSLGLRPRGKSGPVAEHCVNCGDCVVACAGRGKALQLGMAQRRVADKPSNCNEASK